MNDDTYYHMFAHINNEHARLLNFLIQKNPNIVLTYYGKQNDFNIGNAVKRFFVGSVRLMRVFLNVF